jgi:ribosome-binding factor A
LRFGFFGSFSQIQENSLIFGYILCQKISIFAAMSIRQEKFAGIIQQYLSDVFLKHKGDFNNAFITISRVEVSPDLGYAKVFLSFLAEKNKEQLLSLIKLQSVVIRKELANKIKNQARIVPELQFFLDESLDYVFHMEEVMKQVKEQDEKKKNN